MLPFTMIELVGALFRGWVLPARSLQCFTTTLPGAFASQLMKQAGATEHHHMHLASLPRAAPPGRLVPQVLQVPARLQTASPRYLACRAYIEVSSIWDYFQYNEQERDDIEKSGEPPELSRDCGNSLGSEWPVSAIIHVVGTGSIQVIWSACKITAVRSWTHPPSLFCPPKKRKQEQRGITMHIWPLYLELLWLSRPVPQMP